MSILTRFIIFLMFVCGSVAVAEAGVAVAPVQLFVQASNPIAVLTLRNSDPKPVTFQVQTFRWEQLNGKNTLIPVNNLIVSPPIFTVPGDSSQLIRLGFVAIQPNAIQKTYRVLIRQLPGKTEVNKQNKLTVQVLLDLSLPLFVAPDAPTQQILQTRLFSKAGKTYLQLDNQGNVFLNLLQINVTGKNGKAITMQPLNMYLLAHTQQTLQLPSSVNNSNYPLTFAINTSWQNYSVSLAIGQTKTLTTA